MISSRQDFPGHEVRRSLRRGRHFKSPSPPPSRRWEGAAGESFSPLFIPAAVDASIVAAAREVVGKNERMRIKKEKGVVNRKKGGRGMKKGKYQVAQRNMERGEEGGRASCARPFSSARFLECLLMTPPPPPSISPSAA